MDTKALLFAFSALTGVSGQEGDAADHARALLRQYGETGGSTLGGVTCRVREPQPGKPHLLLDAHIDEIGMIVTFITDDGFLRVAGCGGVDRRLLPASLVTVHTGNGPLDGVVCSTPPHLSAGEDKKNLKVEEIYIDIGFGGETARARVCPGDRVTLQARPRELAGGLLTGKALDDRAGCVSILYALELLRDAPLQCGLSVQFSSMEEVGGQGARTQAYEADPTHCVAVDVGFGHTPDAPREKCGELKKGPMIGYAPVLDKALSQQLRELAESENIPWQPDVMGGKTGTNADYIVTTRTGVVTGLLSIPIRYMHTPIETVAVQDVEDTGRLLAAWVRAMGGVR